MNPYKVLWERIDQLAVADLDDKTGVTALKGMGAILLFVLLVGVTGVALIALVAWLWWLGIPVLVYCMWRLLRFVFTDPPEGGGDARR